MKRDLHKIKSYQLIDSTVQIVESWLAIFNKSSCIYKASAINQRVAQAFAVRLCDPFLKMYKDDDQVEEIFYKNGKARVVCCAGMRINLDTGETALNFKLLIINLAKFAALWFLVIGYFLRSLTSRGCNNDPAVLIHGVPDAVLRMNGSTQAFEQFCSNGKLSVLSGAVKNIIQVSRPVSGVNKNKFVYARFPLLTLLSSSCLSCKGLLIFFKQHALSFFCYIRLIIRMPIASLLWRDFAFHATAMVLNRENLIHANIITTTNFGEQYLWMTDLPDRKFQTFMALYSTNITPIVYKEDRLEVFHPILRHLRVDLTWIWDASFKNVLDRIGINCATQVTDPILWYLPDVQHTKTKSDSFRICVFDVTPMNKEALDNRGLRGNYWNANTMKSFLGDVLFVTNEAGRTHDVKLDVILKHKRASNPQHDQTYFDYVDELCRENARLQLANEDTNLFALINSCDLVVAIPYASPAYIANYLGIPSVFYDPTNEVLPTNEKLPLVNFSGSKENFIEILNFVILEKLRC